MLLLAGLMGLMAAGAIAYGEITPDDPGEEEPLPAEDQVPQVNLLLGTEGDDDLFGTEDVDRIGGGAGDDWIFAAGGDDELRGGQGDDTLSGETGEDALFGRDGDDLLLGGAQSDGLVGENGNDVLLGGAEDDSLIGSAGDDVLAGQSGDDTLHGGLGDDSLKGGAGQDVLFGGWGDDLLVGLEDARQDGPASAAEYLNGGGGDDTILAGSADVVSTGEGKDDVYIAEWEDGHAPARIMDLSATEDAVMLVWDDETTGAEPEITFRTAQDGALHISANGTVVAHVMMQEGDPEDIGVTLVPRSALLSAASGAFGTAAE
jgi:Ca2+-binding RTX toxin-like protein